jgi:hypothetical protein
VKLDAVVTGLDDTCMVQEVGCAKDRVACLEYYSGLGLWPAGVSHGFDIDAVDISIIDNLRMMEDVPILCGPSLFWAMWGGYEIS